MGCYTKKRYNKDQLKELLMVTLKRIRCRRRSEWDRWSKFRRSTGPRDMRGCRERRCGAAEGWRAQSSSGSKESCGSKGSNSSNGFRRKKNIGLCARCSGRSRLRNLVEIKLEMKVLSVLLQFQIIVLSRNENIVFELNFSCSLFLYNS